MTRFIFIVYIMQICRIGVIMQLKMEYFNLISKNYIEFRYNLSQM